MAGQGWVAVGAAATLVDGGDGLRFEYREAGPAGRAWPAFAIRHDGVVRAYLNRCAHVGIELDWIAGRFFDDDGIYLVCAAHGATYRPADGACVSGPCRNGRLVALACREFEGTISVFMGRGAGN